VPLARAVKLFSFEEREPESKLASKIWRTRSVPHPAFISVAVPNWEMVVTRQRGRTRLTLRGPETRASTAEIPQDAEFFGIQFALGTFMPGTPLTHLVDGAVDLPQTSRRRFRLDGSSWEYPTYDNADVFIDRLARRGLLVRDPVVVAALSGDRRNLSPRSLQRHMRRATGLSRTAIRLMERATRAADLLDNGTTISDVVALEGYADQAHLTRSLRRFVGQTPAQIATEQR
jgi:AraC-like DNA-binding protein